MPVTVTGNQLTISGDRRSVHAEREGTYHVHERTYRTVPLPADADANDVTADLDAGVLRSSIGKQADSKPRKISLPQRLRNKLEA